MRVTNILKSSKGFTLIEMAIVLVIFGTIVAASSAAYIQWQNWIRVNTTQTNIDNAYAAMEQFVQTNRRYPCPSSVRANRTTNNTIYGLEASNLPNGCAANPQAAAGPVAILGGAPDMFVVTQDPAKPIISHTDATGALRDPGAGTGAPIRIRIGALPFRSLGLDENQAYDGYRNRLMYVVTEHLTVPTSFDPTTGAVSIVDDAGTEYTDAAGGTGHFLIFSMGENGAGAFNREGIQAIPCPAAAAEGQNCDFTNARFRLGEFSTARGLSALDDVMKFGQIDIPSWRRSSANEDGVLGGPQLGIGPAASIDPQEELDVTGVIKLRDDPETLTETEGKLKSESLCAYDTMGNTECFITSAIAGEIINGDGMDCPNSNEFIQGISNNSPNCAVVEVGCPAGKIIQGIDTNGVVDCGDPPPLGCGPLGVTLCSIPAALPSSASGHVEPVNVTSNGFPVSQNYTCTAGSWTAGPQVGVCNCTPASLPPSLINDGCEENTSCGRRYTGDTIETKIINCPSGAGTVSSDRSACVCDPTSEKTSNRNCNSGYWDNFLPAGLVPPSNKRYTHGQFKTTNKTVCTNPTTASCAGDTYKEGANNCTCRNGTVQPHSSRACSNGFSGTETRTKQFQCDGTNLADTTTDHPGTWGRTIVSPWDTSACTCAVGTNPGAELACSSWQPGKIEKAGYTGIPTKIETTLSASGVCSSTAPVPAVDPNTICENAPAQICRWKAYASINPGSASRKENDFCSSECGATGTCEKTGMLHTCQCE